MDKLEKRRESLVEESDHRLAYKCFLKSKEVEGENDLFLAGLGALIGSGLLPDQ